MMKLWEKPEFVTEYFSVRSQNERTLTMQTANNFENIPQELRELEQWVVWRYVDRSGMKTKPPYYPNFPNRPANVSDPTTWGSFDCATAVVKEGKADGIGFVFTEQDEFFGIDIDSEEKVSQEHIEERQKLLKQLLASTDTYAEVSPSGKGLHLIGRGKLPEKGGKKSTSAQIEIYDNKRFFTMTGNIHEERNTIAHAQGVIDDLFARLSRRQLANTNAPVEDTDKYRRLDLDDVEVLVRAKRYSDFESRFNAQVGCEPGRWSETFMAVVGRLDTVTGSVTQVRRLVMQSPMVQKAPPSAAGEPRLAKAERNFNHVLGRVRDNNTAFLYHVDFGRRTWERIKAYRSWEESKGPQNGNSNLRATPYIWRDPATIHARQWLYGRNLIRKQVSVTVAPGGVGKSSLLIAEALAMVTGRELLGKTVREPLRVWSWNLEDPRDEIERRIQAACLHHCIAPTELGDRLFIDTGREQELCIAKSNGHGFQIIEPVVKDLAAEMLERQIDVLIVDPFISSHNVSENDNSAMDAVAKQWAKVADKTNAAIVLVHHTRKQNGDEVTAESGRGAKAVIDAARDVRALNRMTDQEAKKAGIETEMRRHYFRAYSDKANLAPPAANSDWYKLESIWLPNGDAVGVITAWEWPEKASTGVSEEEESNAIRKVQDLIGTERNYRSDWRSQDTWVGNLIADTLKLDIKDDRQQIIGLIKRWVEFGWLKKERRPDGQRKPREFIVVGTLVK